MTKRKKNPEQMSENDDRKKTATRFDCDILRRKGYTQTSDGVWVKAPTSVDRLETREHPEQEGALERKSKSPCKRKGGSAGCRGKRKAPSNRRKQPYKLVVTMSAYLHRYFDDDNLVGALKPVRDELAEWLGVDDGDRRILWEVDQVLTRSTPGVCVKIEHLACQSQ